MNEQVYRHAADMFVRDWLLVVENDYEAWNHLLDLVKELEYDRVRVAQQLHDDWHFLVDQMSSAVEDRVSELASLLLRQMLVMGDYPFESIASYVIERVKEVSNA